MRRESTLEREIPWKKIVLVVAGIVVVALIIFGVLWVAIPPYVR